MPSNLTGAGALAAWLRGGRPPRLLVTDLRARLAARSRAARAGGAPAPGSDPGVLFDWLAGAVPGGLCQNRGELVPFAQHAREHGPLRTVVEIGTEWGATNAFLARLGRDVSFVAGLDRFVRNEPLLHALAPPGVELRTIWGDSHSARVRGYLTGALGGRQVDLLFIDGDHSFRGALADYRDYAPLVRPGGLVAFHDIVPDAWLRSGRGGRDWSGEVPYLWALLKRQFEHREFIADPDQDGRGIGVLVHDPGLRVDLTP